MVPIILHFFLLFGTVFGNEDLLSNYTYLYEGIGDYIKNLNLLGLGIDINLPGIDLDLNLNLVNPTRDLFDLPIELGLQDSYDFIIVGSGSAGSVIANRLSEISNWSILLLEAGHVENPITLIPLTAAYLQFSPYNWGYFMEYEENVCTGLGGNRMHWPRGRALGGTTVINYMIYTRGNKLDYDKWAAQGNPGWSYDDVLPYFIKSEKTSLREADFEYHGTDGYLSTSDSYQSVIVNAFIQAGEELGLPKIDYNAPSTFGVSKIQATVLNGRRHSNARAFLKPVLNRPNLHILTSALVTKLLIDPATKQTYGVEYERLGIKHTVRANKEVILSAGAFKSPQLLMLSGIGPREDLEALGIEVLEDRAVGKNLHDHLTFPGVSFLIPGLVNTSSITLLNALTPLSIADFLLKGEGRLTSLGGVEGIGYIKTEVSNETEPLPDIELLFVGGGLASDFGLMTRLGMNIRDDVYYPLFQDIQTKNQWSIYPMLLHPKSIGYLKLRSTDPHDAPLLHGNFFSDPDNHDVKTFIASIRFIQKISNTTVFQNWGSTINPNHHPGCEEYVFDSDDYWECALRSIAVTLHHQVGTAKMGPADDPEAVVDNELKVYGIGNLRVADCSIIPFAISAHTNAPATMVGEKAADLIKAHYGVL